MHTQTRPHTLPPTFLVSLWPVLSVTSVLHPLPNLPAAILIQALGCSLTFPKGNPVHAFDLCLPRAQVPFKAQVKSCCCLEPSHRTSGHMTSVFFFLFLLLSGPNYFCTHFLLFGNVHSLYIVAPRSHRNKTLLSWGGQSFPTF